MIKLQGTSRLALDRLWPRVTKSKPQPPVIVLEGAAQNDNSPLPALSVIMPSLNQSAFIKAAVESVLSQADTIDVELIVVDGGSRDGTQAILADLQNRWPRQLRWLSVTDRGPADALNKALSLCRSELVGWLNADDTYLPGALKKANETLQGNPDLVMVYGHGQHIDATGQFLSEYPTRAPEQGIEAFSDGCFICQPAAFFRKQALLDIGGLNPELRAGFDFELWFRLFTEFPGKIGFIDDLLAQSRLHTGGITLSQREAVFRESMATVSEYLGHCPTHWVHSYLNELVARFPHQAVDMNLHAHIDNFIRDVSAYLDPEEAKQLVTQLKQDKRLQVAGHNLGIDIHADGWLSPNSELRVRVEKHTVLAVQLHVEHTGQVAGELTLTFRSSLGQTTRFTLPGKGHYQLRLSMPVYSDAPWFGRWSIAASDSFIPSECLPHSSDTRQLCCLVHGLEPIFADTREHRIR